MPKNSYIGFKFHPAVLIARRVKKVLFDSGPSIALKLSSRKRGSLKAEIASCTTIEKCIEFTRRYMTDGSCQIPSEISAAIKAMETKKPRILCEIGTSYGGTSLVLLRQLPTLEHMFCLDLFVRNKEILRIAAPPSVQLHFLDGSSYSPECVKKVQHLLGEKSIDVLFIDGDHRYEGVKQDFLQYRNFVREGGLVLFHDIIESQREGAWSGGVPRIWKEMALLFQYQEFVESKEQHGFGIGALTYRRDAIVR